MTVPCSQLDPDMLATAIVCAIKSNLPATYSARISGQGRFDLFFPDNQCVCVDGELLDSGHPAFPCSMNYQFYTGSPTNPPVPDCNGNDNPDADDISMATSTDCNSNGIPDECDVGWHPAFESLGKYPEGPFPLGLAVGDYDADTQLDVASSVSNFSSPSAAQVLRNFGNGSDLCLDLGTPQSFSVTSLELPSIATGRLIGADTKPDLAVADYSNSKVVLFRNTSSGAGTINFVSDSPQATVSIGDTVQFVLAVDVDGDGQLDLATANGNQIGGAVNVSRKLAGDVFDETGIVSKQVDSGPIFLAAGDLDGDGKPDLVSANRGANTVSILRNTTPGPGQTISFANSQEISTGVVFPTSVTIADFDCDGRNDIAFCGYYSTLNQVGVLRNVSYSGGVFTMTLTTLETGASPLCIAHDDFDRDGSEDLVTANEADDTVSIFTNHGDGAAFTRRDYYAGEGPSYVVPGDIDHDGDDDVLVSNFKEFLVPNIGFVYVVLNEFSPALFADCDADGLPDGCACAGVEPGDVNSDGRIDGRDVQPFCNQLFGGVTPTCPADVNRSGALSVADAPTLVCKLLGRPNCCHGCGAAFMGSLFSETIADCNTNGIDDAEDIANQTSADCNSNGSPDECESLDCNTNGVLDDCETAGGQNDCNSNFLPDECDLLYGPSFDCNTNGVPDECDIADATSEDSNSNGIPDECEQGQGRSMMAGEGDHSESDTGETPAPRDGSTPAPPNGATTGPADPSAAGQSSESTNPYAALPLKWQALMQWLDATDFSAMTPDEIDAALAAKMIELGLLGG
ncbi:MAG: FG-GAP-like repeat-containing protein [Phycisphaerae bacterium]